jgi:hypothetical protein
MAVIRDGHPASPYSPGLIYSGYESGAIMPRVRDYLNPLVKIILAGLAKGRPNPFSRAAGLELARTGLKKREDYSSRFFWCRSGFCFGFSGRLSFEKTLRV